MKFLNTLLLLSTIKTTMADNFYYMGSGTPLDVHGDNFPDSVRVLEISTAPECGQACLTTECINSAGGNPCTSNILIGFTWKRNASPSFCFCVYGSNEIASGDGNEIFETYCLDCNRVPSSQPSGVPSGQPSGQPSGEPSGQPSGLPSGQPSGEPSGQPSGLPSGQPSGEPSGQPSGLPSGQPSGQPSEEPSISAVPSSQPSMDPSISGVPSSQPSMNPSVSNWPTSQPSVGPSISVKPSISTVPSSQPSMNPSVSNWPTSQPSGIPSESPSGQPSSIPSEQPSGQPSGSPSGQPSGSPSGQPSTKPSESPSGLPSSNPSEAPSGLPSESPTGQPSSNPSEEPSGQPSESPSEYPSSPPSEEPSGQPSEPPSEYPSSPPSEKPSGQPSSIPSHQPSITQKPSSIPSLEPSTSTSPTVPQPSAKPSVAPSSRPSKFCPRPTGVDENQPWPPACLNGGMWSIYSCSCLCLSPYCPGADDERCKETTCPQDYHKTLFDDEPEPWFNFGKSCTDHKELPTDVNAIYPSKEDCCEAEYSANSGDCVARPAAVIQLSFHGKLKLVGVDCPNSGSERAAWAGHISRSLLSTICSIQGVKCDDRTRLVLTKFCGREVNIESVYSSGSRRLQDVDEDVVDFILYMESLDRGSLETVQSLLSAYLQGSSLTDFLTAVKDDVLASNPPASLEGLSAVFYTAVAAFISGLGLYYPAWGYSETCLSDGGQEDYMNLNNGDWLYETLESCCERYYNWDAVGCRTRNAEATLVAGTLPSTFDPTKDLYFPDWLGVDTCINDGTAPPYMKKDSDQWMYTDLKDCCQAYYGWKDGFEKCMLIEGGNPPTRSPITESWYVDWEKYICVESCEVKEGAPCGGVHEDWDILHGSKSSCCEAHLWWEEDCMQK